MSPNLLILSVSRLSYVLISINKCLEIYITTRGSDNEPGCHLIAGSLANVLALFLCRMLVLDTSRISFFSSRKTYRTAWLDPLRNYCFDHSRTATILVDPCMRSSHKYQFL